MNEAEREADKQERLVSLLSRSPTRQQLVRLLLEGKSRKAIAAAMKRSQHTIDAHLKVIYRTVGVGDRAQLMLLARDLVRKAVPPPELGSRRIRDVVLPWIWRAHPVFLPSLDDHHALEGFQLVPSGCGFHTGGTMGKILGLMRSAALVVFAISLMSVDARATELMGCYSSGNEGCVCCDYGSSCCFIACPGGDGSVGLRWCDCCSGSCEGPNCNAE